ncbi:hypothetical protein BH10BAC6_BH10BAC6_03240 [soil metagenome]
MSIDIDKFIASLRSMIHAAELKSLYSGIGQILLRSVDHNFREGGRYDIGAGGEFVGGATHRITSARARRQSGQTLMDTGQRAASITAEATSQVVTIGTNKAYGAIHHFGGQAGRNKKVLLPVRPFLVVQEEDLEEIQKAAEDWLKIAPATKAGGGGMTLVAHNYRLRLQQPTLTNNNHGVATRFEAVCA